MRREDVQLAIVQSESLIAVPAAALAPRSAEVAEKPSTTAESTAVTPAAAAPLTSTPALSTLPVVVETTGPFFTGDSHTAPLRSHLAAATPAATGGDAPEETSKDAKESDDDGDEEEEGEEKLTEEQKEAARRQRRLERIRGYEIRTVIRTDTQSHTHEYICTDLEQRRARLERSAQGPAAAREGRGEAEAQKCEGAHTLIV